MPMLTTENVVRIVPYSPGSGQHACDKPRSLTYPSMGARINSGEPFMSDTRKSFLGEAVLVSLRRLHRFGGFGTAWWKSKLTRNWRRSGQVGLVLRAIRRPARAELCRKSARRPEAKLASGGAWTQRLRPRPVRFCLQYRRAPRAPPRARRRVPDPCVARHGTHSHPSPAS